MEIIVPKQLDVEDIAGEFDTTKASIAQDSMPFLFEMMSKSLYSNPIGSICREIASNCFDSHIEANVTKAVIISKRNDDEGDYISFKDFGVGLSPDRIKKVYMNYFSSTKRGNNNEIGGFGLGSKTPLSYTDSFYINTIFDGIKYSYLFSKGETVPTLDLFTEEETEEHNGTEIKIYFQKYNDAYTFEAELRKQLCYFENVFFMGWNIDNNYKIYESETYKFRDKDQYSDEMHICLGKVAYPIDWSKLDLTPIEVPVAIKFGIGELQVTPNREQLRYTEEIIEILQNKIETIKQELINLYNTQNVPFTDFKDWYYNRSKKPFIKIGETGKIYLNYIDVEKKFKLELYENISYYYREEEIFDKLYSIYKSIAGGKELKYISGHPTDMFLSNSKYDVNKTFNLSGVKTEHYHRGALIKRVNFALNTYNLKKEFIEVFSDKKKYKHHSFDDYIIPYTYNFDTSVGSTSVITFPTGTYSNNDVIIDANGTQYYYYTANRKIDHYGNYFGDGVSYFNLGLAKKMYNINCKLREMFEAQTTDYNDVSEEYIAAYKLRQRENDAALQRRLNGKIFVKNFITSRDNEYTIKELEAYKGLIIYGFREDIDKLRDARSFFGTFKRFQRRSKIKIGTRILKKNQETETIDTYKTKDNKVVYGYHDNSLNQKAIKLVIIAKNNAKYFNKKNMTHVKNLKSDFTLFRQKASAIKIERFFAHYLKSSSNMSTRGFTKAISNIFTPIGDVLNTLLLYKEKNLVPYYNGGEDMSKRFKDEILKIAEAHNWFDESIADDIKKVEDWFKDIELLQYTDITDESLPAILKYIRSKGKKLNNDYYLRYVYPEPDLKQVKEIDSYGQIIIMYPEEKEIIEESTISKFKYLTEKQA